MRHDYDRYKPSDMRFLFHHLESTLSPYLSARPCTAAWVSGLKHSYTPRRERWGEGGVDLGKGKGEAYTQESHQRGNDDSFDSMDGRAHKKCRQVNGWMSKGSWMDGEMMQGGTLHAPLATNMDVNY